MRHHPVNSRTGSQRSISLLIALSAAAIMCSVDQMRVLPIMALFVAAAAWFGGLIVGWTTLALIVGIGLIMGEGWQSIRNLELLMVFLALAIPLLHGAAFAFRTRRREAAVNDALVLQQNLLRVVIDGLPMPVAYLDCEQRYRLCNRAFTDLVDGRPVKGAHVRDLFGEEVYADLLPMIESACRGTPARGRVLIRRNGDARHIDVHFQPHPGKTGSAAGVVSLMHDITQQVRVFDVVKSSELRLRTLAMATASIIWIASRDGRLVEAQGWLEFTGQVPLYYTGDGWLEAVHPAERDYVQRTMREAFSAGDTLSIQYRLYSRQSGYRMVHSHAIPIRDAEGGIAEWIGTVSDIEEQYRTQQALLERERERDALLENVPHMVWIADPHGNIVFNNSRWYEYTGLCPGQHWKIATHGEDIDRASALWDVALRTGEKLVAEKRIRRASDGEYRWHLIQGVPIRNAGGAIIRWYGSMTDIEDQKRAIVMLSQANQRISRFLATLSHELRNPISGVLTACELMGHRDFDHNRRPAVLATISRHGEHLQRMLDDLLDISRVTTDTIELKCDRCDVVRILRDLIQDMAPDAQVDGIVVALHAEEPDGPTIWGDAIRLRQIFMNLISNAIKASRAEGRVDVYLARDAEHCRIRVVDQGEGLSDEVRDTLFKPFVQADDWRRRGLGLGLGLFIVQQLTALHGGSVHIEERKAATGAGACFTLLFPLHDAVNGSMAPVEPAAVADGEARAPTSGPGPLLLIIEDERENAESLRWLLELDGYRVDLAFTAVDGIALATSGGYDAVLCDIELADDLDGLDVARALTRLKDRPRLVAYSGYGQPADLARTRNAGFDAHLVKPATIASIKETIGTF